MYSQSIWAWAPPAFLEGGGGGGQDRATGRLLTVANMLSPFGHFNQQDGEGGSAVSFWPIQPAEGGGGGAGCCLLSAYQYNWSGVRALGLFNQWGEGAVHFQPIQPVGGAHV